MSITYISGQLAICGWALFRNTGAFYIGGFLEVLNLPLHFDFKQLRMTPPEVRGIFKKLGWNRIVGYHTFNTIHRPDFEMAIRAMHKSLANLLLLPGVGMTGPGDSDLLGAKAIYLTGFYPQLASFGPGLRTRSLEILNVAQLRLRFQRRCGLGLNQNLTVVKENSR